jgi:hypothetical protein
VLIEDCVFMTDSPKKKQTRAKKVLSAPAASAKKWNRTYLSLSFSAPPDLEGPMNDRAAAKGYRSRSEYLCALVEEDLRKAGLLKEPIGSKVKLSRVGAGSRGGQGGKGQGDGSKK